MDVFWMLIGMAVAILLIVTAFKAVCLVPQARARNVERFGRWRRTLEPGLHFLIPFVDRLRPMIDQREQVMSIREPVITEDNVDLRIDTVLYFRVYNPYQADYHIANYFRGIEKLTGTVLRDVVGDLTLQETLTSRQRINEILLGLLNATSVRNWGIGVTRVEIMTIDPPPSIKEAMESREAAILKAEGQASAIDRVFRAIHEGRPDAELLAYQYLQMLPQLTQGEGSTVVVLPSELTNAIKAVGSAFGAAPAAPAADSGEAAAGGGEAAADGSKPAADGAGEAAPAEPVSPDAKAAAGEHEGPAPATVWPERTAAPRARGRGRAG